VTFTFADVQSLTFWYAEHLSWDDLSFILAFHAILT